MAASAVTSPAGCSGASVVLAVKDTFIHFDDTEVEKEGLLPQRRRLSVPASARLAGPANRICKLSEDPIAEASEASTLSAASSGASNGEESVTPSSTVPSSPLVTPRKMRWADFEEDDPPPPPRPPSGGAQPITRTKLNVNAASWTPGAAAPAAPCAPPAVDPLATALTAQVVTAMQQLQLTFDCGGAPVKVEVCGGELSQCCVMLWVRMEDAWLTESLLTAAREALLRISSERCGVYLLGYNGQPFTPRPHGFSAMLAKMEDKSQACWEMLQQGVCCRGPACRRKHPELGFPVNVVVATTAAASTSDPAA